jgi:hypothetical protein
MTRDDPTGLVQLAADASARGYASLAESVLGVVAVLEEGDPVDAAHAHDLWVQWMGRDQAPVLLRLLGPGDPFTEEVAFPTAVAARVVLAIEDRLTRLSTAAEEWDPGA